MSYNDQRAYINGSGAAQNVVSTASGAVVTSTTFLYLPVAEAAFVDGVSAVVTATPSSPPSGVTYSLLSGTTTIASVKPLMTVGSSAYGTAATPLQVGSGSALQLQVIATGTASATETAGAVNVSVSLGNIIV